MIRVIWHPKNIDFHYDIITAAAFRQRIKFCNQVYDYIEWLARKTWYHLVIMFSRM